MSWYKSDMVAWKEIIETVAAEEHRTAQMIENDTIQSMFLLELSKSELPFVFKKPSPAVPARYDFSKERVAQNLKKKMTPGIRPRVSFYVFYNP